MQHPKSSVTSTEETADSLVWRLEHTDSFLCCLVWLWPNVSISVYTEQNAVFTVWVTGDDGCVSSSPACEKGTDHFRDPYMYPR